MKKWKIVSSKPVFRNRWVHIERVDYQKADGKMLDFYINKGGDIVSVLGLTKDEQVVVVEQYRPAVNTITIDLPGGAVDKGETPLQAARREFKEETGLQITKLQELITIFHDSGRSHQKKYFFIGNVQNDILLKGNNLHDECRMFLIPIASLLDEFEKKSKKTYELSIVLAATLYFLYYGREKR